jgi:hypothetical protein
MDNVRRRAPGMAGGRSTGLTHHQALRAVANRWVGILHACLTSHERYREDVAWPAPVEAVA